MLPPTFFRWSFFMRSCRFTSCFSFCLLRYSRPSPLGFPGVSLFVLSAFGQVRGAGGSRARIAFVLSRVFQRRVLVLCTLIRFLMETEIKHLGRALQLIEDEDNGLRLSEELWEESSAGNHLFLVGRLLVNKDVNFGGLARSLKSMSNPVKGVNVKALPEGCFLFRGPKGSASVDSASSKTEAVHLRVRGDGVNVQRRVPQPRTSKDDSMASFIPETGREAIQ
ncbi:hypothetical protein Salat_2412400 [Sesamum alatum]|uniref:Uncharacterized protein n=1 Tax=Sesamum alatum TaxID=300844 RepID=A0AAE1XXT2_9LAMI|nr:hypothetical protein Salat_2412400 [Sesamum alatum]